MWNSTIKSFFLVTFLILLLYLPKAYCIDSVKAAAPVIIDSSVIEVRTPPAEKQQELLSNPDYKYDRKIPSPNFWDRFKDWVSSILERVFNSEGGGVSITILYYLIVAVAIGLITFLLLKNNIRFLFYGKSAALPINFREFDDDIHKINFNELIAAAIAEKDYRKAVRLNFLKLLKDLTDKNLITWKIDKTNNDYFSELSNSAYSNSFKELAFLYEHIWYGNFDIDENNFNTVLSKFNTLKVEC